jgi:hypothetical protein
MDRGYMDFYRLKKIDSAGAFFVIRGKRVSLCNIPSVSKCHDRS